MTSNTLRRTFTAALTLATLTVLAACSSIAIGGRTATDAEVAKSCPASGGLTTEIGIDGSVSHNSEAIKKINLAVIGDQVRATAICGGHLRVFGFASSTGQTVTLYDGQLNSLAPTDNAHYRQADKLTEQVSGQISQDYDHVLNGLTGTGSDPLGMLTVLQQAAAQAPASTLNGILLTDGLQNIGIDATTATNNASAKALADSVSVPTLKHADITIVGIGRQAQGEIPSSMIENVTTFWERVCQRTQAASCQVSTDGR